MNNKYLCQLAVKLHSNWHHAQPGGAGYGNFHAGNASNTYITELVFLINLGHDGDKELATCWILAKLGMHRNELHVWRYVAFGHNLLFAIVRFISSG